ncbi:MAG: CDP-alcohol phosphatidyltransferase family protein [Acidobacteriaceae bacterium]|nr:CDP-alcohol phosphatidyltransferase family protein [Acidobacteriaceae bacterium]
MSLYEQFRAAPNLLTLARLFIIPFLVIAILDGRFRTAFALLVLAGCSDAFDGLLARWLRQRTVLGQYLDPIADKVLLSTLFLVLTHVGLIPRYVTVLVFSRDLGILLVSSLLFATGTLRDFRPNLLGKLNTLVQVVGVLVVMLGQLSPALPLTGARCWLLRSIAVLTTASGVQYAWVVMRRVQSHQPTAV